MKNLRLHTALILTIFLWIWLLVMAPVANSALLAQVPPEMRLGEVEAADFDLKRCDFDPKASVVVLSDWGKVYINVADGTEKTRVVRHIRMKVLSKEGLRNLDHAIRLYSKHGERLTDLEGFVIDREGEKVSMEPITREHVYMEEPRPNWQVARIVFSGVKVGSILDFKYEVSSNRIFTLPVWNFQGPYPVARSVFEVTIPEFYDYHLIQIGLDKPVETWNKPGTQPYSYRDYSNAIRSEMVQNRKFGFLYRNIPAFEPEVLMPAEIDQIGSLRLELSAVRYPGQERRDIITTWEDVADGFWAHNSFGKRLEKTQFLNKLAKQIREQHPEDELERAMACVRAVSEQVRWNGDLAPFSDRYLKLCWEDQIGNAGSVNLILMSLLEKAGLGAEPVLVSSREYGKVMRDVAILNSFDYLVVLVKIDGKDYYLDACIPDLPPFHLPPYAINGWALALRKDKHRWVLANNGEVFRKELSAKLKIGEDEVTGSVDIGYESLAAWNFMRDFAEKGVAGMKAELEEDYPELQLSAHRVEPATSQEYRVREHAEFSSDELVIRSGDRLYLSVAEVFGISESPFQAQERRYPIDFTIQQYLSQTMEVEIPTGYRVESVPDALSFFMNGGRGSATFKVEQQGQKLIIQAVIYLSSADFAVEEYSELKALYDELVNRNKSQIVLVRE